MRVVSYGCDDHGLVSTTDVVCEDCGVSYTVNVGQSFLICPECGFAEGVLYIYLKPIQF